MITETATHRPEEDTLARVSLLETSEAEGDIEDSGASEELNTLRPETFDERLTTTENIYEETATAQTTTTIPDEEEQTDRPRLNKDEEEQFEVPEEQTTAASKGDTSKEEPTTTEIANEVVELMKEE